MPDASTLLEVTLRWMHFVAGITWIGLLYFFNLVNVPLMKALDGPTKGKVIPILMPKALWWFRHAAWATVLVGWIYYAFLIVPGDPAGDTHHVVVVQLVVSLLAWAAIYALLSPLKGALNKGPVLAVIIGVVALVQAILIAKLTGGEGHSSRAVSIGVGGGMGIVMMLNVWGIIWRSQKKIIAWTAENAAKGTPIPPESAMLARRAFLASRTNAWLSLPMLFFMATASHGATIVGPWFGAR
jgi:uncharacterized membrane protein